MRRIDDAFGDLRPGDLVEGDGEYVGNVLKQIVDFFDQILPYTGLEDEKPKPKNPKQSGNPAKRAQARTEPAPKASDGWDEEAIRMMRLIKADLDGSPVEDAVISLDDEGRELVLTLSREFLTPETRAQMFASRVRVIGKVARVLEGTGEINLMRRTALGAAGPEMATEIVRGFGGADGLHMDLGAPVVKAPGIQVQPLAVFL